MTKITITEKQLDFLKKKNINEEGYYPHTYTRQINNYLSQIAEKAGCECGGYDEDRNLFIIESNCGTGEYIFDITEDTGVVYLRDVRGKFYTDESDPNTIVNEFNKLSSLLLKHPFIIQK